MSGLRRGQASLAKFGVGTTGALGDVSMIEYGSFSNTKLMGPASHFYPCHAYRRI